MAATVPTCQSWGSLTQTEAGSRPCPVAAASERRTERYWASARLSSVPAAAIRLLACVAERVGVDGDTVAVSAAGLPAADIRMEPEEAVDRGAQLVHRLRPLGEDQGELTAERLWRRAATLGQVGLG